MEEDSMTSSSRGRNTAMESRNKQPKHPPLSYSIRFRITIRWPKIRIKAPKLLAKTIRTRFDHGCNDNEKKMRNKPRKLLPRKIGSNFINAFGNMMIKSPDKKSSSNGRNLTKSKAYYGNRANDDVTKVCAPFCYVEGDHSKRVGAGVANNYLRVIGEQESSKPKVGNLWKSRVARSLTKTASRKFDEDSKKEDNEAIGERGGEELCKKRILLGGKCKALSSSGTLQYDENGILITDEDLKKEDNEAIGERGGEELCKKRILLGGKCKALSSGQFGCSSKHPYF